MSLATQPVPVRSPLPTALAGQTALIIGGSSGIGLAAARLLAEVGARLILVARDELRLEAAASLQGADVATFAADATDEARLTQIFDAAGTVDHVLVTAGSVVGGALADADRSTLQGSIDNRVWGAYAAARVAAPRLAPGSSLTLMSGTFVVRPIPNAAAAIAGAAATEGLTRGLAVELAPRRIRVNALRAGAVDTPLMRSVLSQDGELEGPDADAAVAHAAKTLPLGRFGTAEEAAAAALFVMANPYMTGSLLTIDGGQSLS
ncbi:SDR family oxidoreductase [Streptomyces sp. NPDC051218]|uniref:SDR family oxidoreductase n=1 Tax=Streptomyces sp. NPDC051218 TaxID=3365645 RepID=UPI00379377E2